MGAQLRLGRHWFHKDHYDLPINRRDEIEAVALIVNTRTIVRVIRNHKEAKLAVNRELREYEKMRRNELKGVHYCPDWDYMAIHDQSPEFDACTCPHDSVYQ